METDRNRESLSDPFKFLQTTCERGLAMRVLAYLATLRLSFCLGDLSQAGRSFAPPLIAGLFVMLVRASLFENSALHGLLFEASKGRIDSLTRLDNHLCQMFIVLSFAVMASQSRSCGENVRRSIP